MTKPKTVDCVEMKRRGAQRVQDRLKDLTPEQRIEYWRRRSEEFLREQERLRQHAAARERSVHR